MTERRNHATEELEDLREENALLLQQLRRVQEELEHYYLLYSNATSPPDWHEEVSDISQEAQVEVERRARVAAEKARDAILASTSWRITAPLRWLQVRITGRQLDQIAPSPPAFPTLNDERKARVKAEKQTEALLQSTSWKVAAPIRARPVSRKKLIQRIANLEKQYGASCSQRDELKQQLAATKSVQDGLMGRAIGASAERDSPEQRLRLISAERDRLRQQVEAIASERDSLKRELNSAAASQRELKEQIVAASATRAGSDKRFESDAGNRDQLQQTIDEISRERDEALAQRDRLNVDAAERERRQQILDTELTKAEAQITLIKDLLLREQASL
jgi:chromosome segregation ATPase